MGTLLALNKDVTCLLAAQRFTLKNAQPFLTWRLIMKTLHTTLATAVSAALLVSSSIAWADTASDDLDISITIAPACTLDSVDDVTASHAVGVSGAQAQSGSVRVTCNTGHTYTIAMGAGTNASGAQRRVHDGSHHIDYDLIKTSNSATWGSGGTSAENSMNTAADENGTGSGSQQTWGYQVQYALAGTEAAGTYTDQVLVVLEF